MKFYLWRLTGSGYIFTWGQNPLFKFCFSETRERKCKRFNAHNLCYSKKYTNEWKGEPEYNRNAGRAKSIKLTTHV